MSDGDFGLMASYFSEQVDSLENSNNAEMMTESDGHREDQTVISSSNEKLAEFHVDISNMSMVLNASAEEKRIEYFAEGEIHMTNSSSSSSTVKEFRVNIPKNSSISMILYGSVEEKGNKDSKDKGKTIEIGGGNSLENSNKAECTTKNDAHREDQTVISSSNEKLAEEELRARYFELYRAALRGDWETAKAIYQVHGDDRKAKISKHGHTALHIAAAAKCSNFAINLVHEMARDDLALQNMAGNTAFALAAATGGVELAEKMREKNENLVTNNGNKNFPLYQAALFGRKEMVKGLYKLTPDAQLNNIELLLNLIRSGFYETALDLLTKKPGLAEAQGGKNETALYILSKIRIAKPKGFLKRCFNLFSCIHKSRHKEQLAGLELVEGLWKQVIYNKSDSEISKFIREPKPLISAATERGNIEFLRILIDEYPDLIFEKDKVKQYTIFHYAVMYRQNDIFKLIYEIGSLKDLLIGLVDEKDNNILHLAAQLAPTDRLNTVAGAALQMQREFLWFKAVEELVFPLDVEAENEEGKTPRALFTESHNKLKEKGEQWVRDTANSCLIVATLIATVVFAAAFTVPGGTNETTGSPNFIHEVSLKIFVIADALSLVSSSCSILTFVSLLTYRYTEEAFIFWLPTKLLFGLLALFISIASMMAVFCATYFIVFKEGEIKRAIYISAIASIPVILYLYHQIPLFFSLVRSTYFSSSLFKPSLFQRRKRTLFNKKRKAKMS